MSKLNCFIGRCDCDSRPAAPTYPVLMGKQHTRCKKALVNRTTTLTQRTEPVIHLYAAFIDCMPTLIHVLYLIPLFP